MKIIMMIGIAGSGKSTWALTNKPDAIMVSTDDIRERLWGDARIQKNPALVFATAFQDIREAISVGRDIVFDATNITRKDRKKALAQFPNYIEVEAVFIDTPLHLAIERNASRQRVVPNEVLYKMYSKLEPPVIEEGFTKIIVVKP